MGGSLECGHRGLTWLNSQQENIFEAPTYWSVLNICFNPPPQQTRQLPKPLLTLKNGIRNEIFSDEHIGFLERANAENRAMMQKLPTWNVKASSVGPSVKGGSPLSAETSLETLLHSPTEQQRLSEEPKAFLS